MNEQTEIEIQDEIDPIEYRNGFTIRSVAALMRSNADIYAGAYGRVNLRRGDVVGNKNGENCLRLLIKY